MQKNINSSSLTFLRDLKEHNNREWFAENKARYDAARADFLDLVEQLLQGMEAFEPAAKDQKAKDTIFRIYRDVRFSPNKNPYKDHFGAYIAKGGRKSLYPGYYIHLSAGGHSFLAGGLWHLPAEEMKAARQEIDYNFQEFQAILNRPEFQTLFGALSGEKLSRPTKGYDKENPAVEFLKFKTWTVSWPIPDQDLTQGDLIPKMLRAMETLKPLNDFFSRPLDDLKA